MAIDVANQADWNTAVAAVAAAGANSTVSINITSGFTLSSSLAQLQASNANVVINITGNNQVINGASAFQGIQVNGANAPTVNISSLSITNTAALGGNGQNGQDGYFSGGLSYGSGGGGGGGLGAGGGLFVGSGANVTLAAVTFTGNTATGGTGGNGGSAQNAAPDLVNGGNGGNGGAANNGGASGGGGAGGTGGHAGNQGTAGTAGGTLGAGGGGGGGSGTTNSTTYTSNNSGGSGNANGGNGGSGGDGATNASGSGGPGPGADGGAGGNGGAANGGAIYVATGGTLTILNSPISGAAVTGGAAGTPGIGIGPSALNGFSAAAGAAQGAGIFLSGVTANIGVSGGTVTYANTIGGSGLTTGGVNTALIKTGVGTLVLSAANTYSGNTVVNAGTLEVNGTAANSALTTVNSGGQLAGVGTVKGTQINAGGTFAPGNGTPASTMSVNGNLAFQSGAIYLIQVDPTTASRANVSGTASLNGTVNATFASGTYVAKQYTILNATGGVSGTFAGVVNIGNPANLRSSLSYDANNAYLNVTLGFNGFTTNQQNLGNALINFFNANGGIPAVYANLSPAELTQASGEAATGSQQTTFNAMNMFMGIMTDPFIAGRGEGGSAGGGATGYADEELAYAASRKPADAMAAIYAKAPRPAPFAQRWSVWAAGYGGSQTTDGNAVVGSNTATSSIYGTAVGADYRISPYTIAGFALAGGGTNFNVVNSGYGQSYLFQAGAFVRHTIGAAYLSGALAYGAQDITTNRIVTIAGTDRLQARFNANAYSGRVEGGYRFVTPWMNGVGITPYAAGQFTTFDLPAYTESAISGGGAFALAYGAKSVTDTRSELGVRTDKSFAMDSALLTLRGRAAWSHDYNPDRTIGATFTALPGASFVVNGAAQASDSALVTAAAEMKWMNGWSAVGTFEGEFSNVTRSYAGKGVVRYNW